MTKPLASLIGCLVFVGCAAVAAAQSGGHVVAFVIDSSSGMTPRERDQFRLFPEITHGDVVQQLLWQSGAPRELIFRDVDDERGKVDRGKYLAALAEVAEYMAGHPLHRVVVNLSIGSNDPDDEERQGIEDLVARGAVIVAAAGNESADRVYFPAAYPDVIAVGAADCTASPHVRWADYSNHGPEIDVLADGFYEQTDLVSMLNETMSSHFSTTGTSFATPRVTGTVVRMLRLGGQPQDVQRTLRETARPIPDKTATAGHKTGVGILYPHAALTAVKPGYWTFWLRIAALAIGAIWALRTLGTPTSPACLRFLAAMVSVASAAVFFLWLNPLLAEAHAIPAVARPLWLTDPMAMDIAVTAVAMVLATIPVTLPALLTSWSRRWQRAAMIWEAADLAVKGQTDELKSRLESHDPSVVAATLRGILRSGEDLSDLLAEWLVDGGIRQMRNFGIATLLTEIGQRRPLKPVLRRYLICDRTELLRIPELLEPDDSGDLSTPEWDNGEMPADQLAALDGSSLREALTEVAETYQKRLLTRLPGVRRRKAAAIALRRLGWSHDEDVQRAVAELEPVDPFYQMVDDAIQGRWQEAYEPEVEPLFENRRVMLVAVGLILAAVGCMGLAILSRRR